MTIYEQGEVQMPMELTDLIRWMEVVQVVVQVAEMDFSSMLVFGSF